MSADTPNGQDQPPRGDPPPRPAERATGQERADGGQPRPPAETRTRAEYNEARHAEPPIQRQDADSRATPADRPVPPANSNGPERRAGPDQRPATADAGAGVSADRTYQSAETRTRAEYNEARHAEPPIQRSEHPAKTAAREGPAEATHPRHPDAGPAENAEHSGNGASASPADASGGTAIGEQAGADHPEGEKNKRQPEPDDPAKVYVDGREIEITGDPADGIWIPGLPGEVPGKTGDVLASPEKSEDTLGNKAFKKVFEVSDDLIDAVEKNVTVSSEVMQRPPTYAEVPVSNHHPVLEAQQYDQPEVGSLATAVLATGIMMWAGARWIDERLKGAHHARDG